MSINTIIENFELKCVLLRRLAGAQCTKAGALARRATAKMHSSMVVKCSRWHPTNETTHCVSLPPEEM